MVFPVPNFPASPGPATPFDWRRRAVDYDAFVYRWSSSEDYPTIRQDLTHYNSASPTYKLPSYLGDNRLETDGLQEAVNQIASVVGATLVGIDKSAQGGRDYVDMLSTFFRPDLGVALNMPAPDVPRSTALNGGDSYWYATAPNVLLFMLGALYPRRVALTDILGTIADRYHDMASALGGDSADFDGTGFDFRAMRTCWNQADVNEGGDGAAGAALIGLWAYARSGERRHLELAKRAMSYLERARDNLFYEVLPVVLPYVASRMNAELGTAYEVDKYLGWLVAGSEARPGWGTLTERWGDHDVHGLIGSRTDGGGYGFAMNSFATAFLAPAVKYRTDLKDVVGRWLYNACNAARFFYADQVLAAHQFYGDRFVSRPEHVIAYEGIRKLEAGKTPCATGDPERYGNAWGLANGVTNLGLYGSSWVGMLAATTPGVDKNGFLRADLNSLDFFAQPAHPTYLYYNPGPTNQIELWLGETVDIYDPASDEVVRRDAQGHLRLPAEPGRSVVLVHAPPGNRVEHSGGRSVIDGLTVRYAGSG